MFQVFSVTVVRDTPTIVDVSITWMNTDPVTSAPRRTEDRLQSIVEGQSRGDLIGGPSTLAGLLLKSVYRLRRFDPDDVLKSYVSWWIREGFDTGPVADAVFAPVNSGATSEAAFRAADDALDGKTAGCGPMHRNVVLAIVEFLDDEALECAVRAEAGLTHRHVLAADASVAAVRIARGTARGAEWGDTVATSAAGLSDEIIYAVSSHIVRPNDPSGFAPSVLKAAIHCVEVASSFNGALARSIELAGPDNYVAVLAGASAGARWGVE